MSTLLNSYNTASSHQHFTANGAVTHGSSLDACVDLFFLAGSSRGKNITPVFASALNADKNLTGRLLLWMRDVLQGAGEREQFRKLFQYLIYNDFETAQRILKKIPVDGIGRWDDVLVAIGTPLQDEAVDLIVKALKAGDGLCAKWMPRRQKDKESNNMIVNILAKALNPDVRPYDKQEKIYRKTLSSLSKTVEQQMCAQQWSDINYNHTPSKAAQIYRKAFARHDESRYQKYLDSLTKQDGTAKVNAKASYPHEVVMMALKGQEQLAEAQWKALPNFMENSEEGILPVVDVSASMTWTPVAGSTTVYPIHIARSLGLYLSEKNKGPFQNEIMSFSENPKLYSIEGSIRTRFDKMHSMDVGGSTNIVAAFELILKLAVKHNLPQSDVPSTLLILSDMEFNSSGRQTAYDTVKAKFEAAGYKLPKVVFWNLNGRVGNNPVQAHQSGAALVSGYSASIMSAVLGCEDMSPRNVMLNKLLSTRYDF